MISSISFYFFIFIIAVLYCVNARDVDIDNSLQSCSQSSLFAQLNLKFPTHIKYIPEVLERTSVKSIESFGDQLPLTLKNLKDKYGLSEVDYLHDEQLFDNSWLPDSIRDKAYGVIWQVITAEKVVLPHRDTDRITALNYYFKVNGRSETVFYTNATEEYIIPMLENRIYSEEWVTKHSSFHANQGDVYLLNVGEIHSVTNLARTDEERVSLSIGFKESYETILALLEEHVINTCASNI